MGLGNILILTQTTAYVINFLFSFFIFIPVVVNLAQFNGKCLLFATGHWVTNSTTDPILDVNWGNDGPCSFPVFVGAVTMPLSLLYILVTSVYLFKGTEPSWLSAFANLLVCAITTLMVFVCGIVVAVGFHDWCLLITRREGGIDSCEWGEYRTFLSKDVAADSFGYFTEFAMSLFGLWASWCCWVILLGCAIIQMYRYHLQEDFFTSLTRERERLIQRTSNSYDERI